VESTITGKSKTLIKVAVFSALLVSLLLFLIYKGLHGLSLGSLVKNDLPMLNLDLRFIDLNGEDVPADLTKLASEITASGRPAAAGNKVCPEIEGGDTGGSSGQTDEQTPKDCPKTATWYVKRHPIGVSLSFNDPQRLRSLFESNQSFKEIWQSRFVQGVLHDPLRNASIRAENLGLQELEGAFLTTLIQESLAAHARLDYDMVHG
jgi:hypothetical protein